jgi:hypothetical protein
MSRPRNPRHFPRMKVRGARRRRLAPMQLVAGSFDRLSFAARISGDAIRGLTLTFERMVRVEQGTHR